MVSNIKLSKDQKIQDIKAVKWIMDGDKYFTEWITTSVTGRWSRPSCHGTTRRSTLSTARSCWTTRWTSPSPGCWSTRWPIRGRHCVTWLTSTNDRWRWAWPPTSARRRSTSPGQPRSPASPTSTRCSSEPPHTETLKGDSLVLLQSLDRHNSC